MVDINGPLFCVTADLDWASDYAISDFLTLVGQFGVKPTVFATHKSEVLDKFVEDGVVEVGVHPNFLLGSSHGNDVASVIDHICGLFPRATTFRSHCFFDNSSICEPMVRRGFHYDSNLCLYMQPKCVPLRHSSGLVRFPVFWEDDVHWAHTGEWRFDSYVEQFFSPGLKIIDVHPFTIAANVPSREHYLAVKTHTKTLSADTLNEVRFPGEGARTFLLGFLEAAVSRKERFYTLGELYQMFSPDMHGRDEDAQGRHTTHTDEEYKQYWAMSEVEKQTFLKRSYEQRRGTDVYATSRDYNLRELEIFSLKRHISRKGKILDLGCGNGYTLLSLARDLPDWNMTGVDFVETLIEAAHNLRDGETTLGSRPDFIYADAIKYLKTCDSRSVHYVITERFLNNLPSFQTQKDVILEVYRVLIPGGRLLMCEGSENGFEALNELRAALGLARIPASSKDNISAIRFKDAQIEDFVQNEVGFSLRSKDGFGMYFVISRVLHPELVMPQTPRFDGRINDIARQIQQSLPLDPTYGSNVVWVLEKPASAAI